MEKITVIGAGIMGRGIAYASATAGFDVTVHDINEATLQKAKKEIMTLIDDSTKKGFLNQGESKQAKQNISFTSELSTAVKEADLVIEAVLEKLDVKISVFQEVEKYCRKDTILATNTSTMSPTEIGAQTSRPEKFIAMHFFNPVHKMKLIEVIRGLDTSDETVEFIKNVSEKLGKEIVEVNEFPGFVTSRMNSLIGNEAMNMFQEGVASAEHIDKAMKLGLNHPMGPLELADLVGLDTRLRNMQYLHKTLGEQYRPAPVLIKYVKAGRLGRKSGHGFYKYD